MPLHVKSPKSDDASCVGPTSSTVRAPPEFVRPEPSRLLNELPLTMRLVVEANTEALVEAKIAEIKNEIENLLSLKR